MLCSLLPVKPGRTADDHVADYFLARRKSPGSWGGEGCPSKQPLYFQRLLKKSILCHWQASVSFPEDTSFFPLSVFICFCTTMMTCALIWITLERECFMLLCPFLWTLFSCSEVVQGCDLPSLALFPHTHMHFFVLWGGGFALSPWTGWLCKRRRGKAVFTLTYEQWAALVKSYWSICGKKGLEVNNACPF